MGASTSHIECKNRTLRQTTYPGDLCVFKILGESEGRTRVALLALQFIAAIVPIAGGISRTPEQTTRADLQRCTSAPMAPRLWQPVSM